MELVIILKVTKKQGYTLTLDRIFFKIQPSEFRKMTSGIFLQSSKVFKAARLKSQWQKFAVIGKFKGDNLESTMTSCLLDIGDDLSSLASWPS